MQTKSRYLICLLVALLCLGGCSSVQVLETWKSSAVTAASPHTRLLIVNLHLDHNIRKMYEDIVAGEMNDNGLQAVAGHTYITWQANYTRDDIRRAVSQSGCDAVLTTRGLTTGNQQLSQQGQGNVLYAEGLIPSSWDDVLTATLQTNLFHAGTGQLVWSATVKAANDDNKFIESRDMGELLIKLLRRDGMVQP